MPYLGSLSGRVKQHLNKIQKRHLPGINLVVIFKSSCRLSSLFSYKDRLPSYLSAGVIYKFTCCRCNSTYIGKTKLHVRKRFSEHLGRSPLTGRLVKGQCSTTVRDHMLSCDTNVSFSDFTIIDRDSSSKALKIKESLYIRRDCPTLNVQGQSFPLKWFK